MRSGNGDELTASEQALIDVALSLTTRLDVRGTCSAVLDAAERVYAARSSWILLHDSASNTLETVDFRGVGAESYREARIPAGSRAIAALAFRTREPIFVPDAAREHRWFDAERVRRSGIRTVVTVPLVYGDAALGILGLDSDRFSAEKPPSRADLARLQAFAAQAAVGIRNARLFEAIEQDRQRLRRLLGERRQLRSELWHLRAEAHDRHGGLVGDSQAFQAVLQQVELVGPADSTVLILGETGTGKEVIARAIHRCSRRSAAPFIAINCAALPETLVESELFGYEKGAFTGAVARTPGKFELADRGTVFLDEIGDLPAPAQAKLLRVLQEREVQRIGASRAIPVNVRVIAATNQDLESGIASGRFRADLFYRLSVFPIQLPPLRHRRDDIPKLVASFLQTFAAQQHKRVPDLAPGTLERLVAYDWPGNVRELQNVIERAVILTTDSSVRPESLAIPDAPARTSPSDAGRLPAPLSTSPGQTHPDGEEDTRPAGAHVLRLFEAERRAIQHALDLAGWRISGPGGAAQILGLKPTTLHAKMKKLGIRRPSAHIARDAADRA